ncbi:MAG: CvpA family protein [Anaerotruncus sp.]|nr:CvpA family protein [Anaerotruncus sp.]
MTIMVADGHRRHLQGLRQAGHRPRRGRRRPRPGQLLLRADGRRSSRPSSRTGCSATSSASSCIFVLVLIAGAVLGHLITKAMKGPLAFANRLFGALFGFVKAVLICGILVFALVSFEVAKPALETSVLAPACLGVTRAVINLIPQDLRARFNSSYKRIRESGGKHGQEI